MQRSPRPSRNGSLLSMEIEFNSVLQFPVRLLLCFRERHPAERTDEGGVPATSSRQAKELGARKMIVLGGEPMLYPHIMEMIRFIRGLDMDIELFTNGTEMTPEMARTCTT